MIASCSPESRLRRFFRLVPSAPEGYLEEVLIDRRHHHAYVVWLDGEVVGLAELHRSGPGTGDLGLIIEEASQRRGVGTAALRFLVCRAGEIGIRRLHADTHLENSAAISLFRYLGTVLTHRETDVLHMELDLQTAENMEAMRRFCVYA